MGYLLLALALSFGIIKAYCGKKTASAAALPRDAIMINAVRMSICAFLGIAIVLFSGASDTLISEKIILISLLSGVANATFTVSWLLSVHSMAFMMVEVFVMGGSIIPLLLCAVIYKEKISVFQIFGVLLLLIAVYCMCTRDRTGKIGMAPRDLIPLLLTAVSSGLCDFSQKLFVKEAGGVNTATFNFYTYLFATVILLLALCFLRLKSAKASKTKKENKVVIPILHYVVIMAVCLFLNVYFKTLAAGHLDAVLLYPLNQGCAVLLSLLMSMIIFKEKMNTKGFIGIGLSVIAMIIINVVAK